MEPGWKTRAISVIGAASAIIAALSLLWVLVEIFLNGGPREDAITAFVVSVVAAIASAIHFADRGLQSLTTANDRMARLRELARARRDQGAAALDSSELVSAAVPAPRPAPPAHRAGAGHDAELASAA